jgi:predicted CXXCH cytochrome family protein
VDAHFEAVQIFDADGTLLLDFGAEGRGPGGFWLPAGIFIDRRNRIWIADTYNKRVQVFDYIPEGKPVRKALIRLIVLAIAGAAPSGASGQTGSILSSPHNLSASGPGAIRASSEQEICIFCHTPHNASPIQPVWNRNMPVSAYTVYSSNSLEASPGQPTGSSKLCLSCHDGSIAVGSVLSREQPIAMAGGVTTVPPGASNLGTDLSDDHPISFIYDQNLVGRDPKIKPPSMLPQKVKLDARGEMQCTSCHDAHDNSNGKFLVMNNAQSQLCNACHQLGQTTIAAHTDCESCHQQHSAPSGAHLLKGMTATDTCATCHGGQTGPNQGANVVADLNKLSRHGNPNPTPAPVIRLRVAEKDRTAVNCGDCHESHTMQSGTASAPQISPKLGQVTGVSASGAQVVKAQFTYEVCYKCHADQNVMQQRISRLIAQPNVRLQFAPSAVSAHPVTVSGKSADVPSLRPGLTTSTTISCTDCHASETGKASGGNGPGRTARVKRYAPVDRGVRDDRRHVRERFRVCSVLPLPRAHKHPDGSVVRRPSKPRGEPAPRPCSVCHDGHGISSAQGTMMNNANLINFDISVVQPDPVTNRLEYRTMGPRMGECFLSCHGVPHSPKAYPVDVKAIPDVNKVKTPQQAVPQQPAETMQPLKRTRPTGNQTPRGLR